MNCHSLLVKILKCRAVLDAALWVLVDDTHDLLWLLMMGALDMMLKVLIESSLQLLVICIQGNEWKFLCMS
jgi:hypothetical protein